MSNITKTLDEFQKEHERLRVKYPSHLKWGGQANFTIVNKSQEPYKFFIQYINEHNLYLTSVPRACRIPSDSILDTTYSEQCLSVESVLKRVLEIYEDKGIMTHYPNSVKFIMSLE